MLATQRMSSHGGQQNFPFGYQQENIHGLGLPEFMNPGPPPGQPLLNAHENQDLDNFFHDFDQNAAVAKHPTPSDFNMLAGSQQYFAMPPMFVGSETGMGQRFVVDPRQFPGAGLPYSAGMMAPDMNMVKHADTMASGMPATAYSDGYAHPLITQLQTAASMEPAFGPGWQQQQPFPAQANMNMQQLPARQGVAFGTDSRFQPSGYAAPNNLLDPDMPAAMQTHPLDWFQPASASTTQPNTQPNTRPNTQPSSPNWSKKRTFDEFHADQNPRNDVSQSGHSQQAAMAQPSKSQTNARRKRSSVVKHEQPASSSQQATPLTTGKPHTPLKVEGQAVDESNHGLNVEGEEEDDEDVNDGAATEPEAKSPSPAPWPSNKARPPRNPNPPPPKGSRKKKASVSSAKSKTPRASSGGRQITPSTRVPLTLEQKKANHTNSEQRRRDATARAYAELYDLVPELEDMGKQSTMKKLEVVVAKVQRVKQSVEMLSARLGVEPLTGRRVGPSGTASLLHSDVQWQQ
ncbi:hypothetical protein ABEF92_007863 [Exophiala dermatitidis]|uniref:BHLH domain-containing protein n=2 Tax=Exophiala dermatitidis TaxID=5970 RepID=H6C757_EXODN|nr:uncharacterized protein HMPREF1120_07541 [Exophiala dermatitidis NIH/UT8656]EHY59553.1 hypothetical protein HMPREF1120_07541 [Exophiala dermatitidis NIH/UT8656]